MSLVKRHAQNSLTPFKNPVSASASKPFRSPLAKKSVSSSVSSTPTNDRRKIQQLEKKLMILKQAHKYRADGSTEHLNQLVSKWKTAAREAAQELWALAQTGMSSANSEPAIRESQQNGDTDGGGWNSWGYEDGKKEDDVLAVLKGGSSKATGFGDSWGWDEGDTTVVEGADDWSKNWEPPSPATLGSQMKPSGRSNSEFQSVLPADYVPQPRDDPKTLQKEMNEADEDNEVDKEENNIGTMLVQLGIPKETLGWNDADEDFVD